MEISMLQSMTGFGSASGESGGVQYSVEIRSVNNRYLKTHIKLPEGCQSAESTIAKLLRKRIDRGTVSVTVRMRISGQVNAHQVNREALAGYLDQLRSLKTQADPQARIELGSLLLLPGVCEPPSTDAVIADSINNLTDLAAEALDKLVEMRNQEGKALFDILNQHCDTIDTLLKIIITRSPDVVKEYHERLKTRIEELIGAGRSIIDANVLAREIAIFAERSDIAEETDRLTGHIVEFRKALNNDGAVGRKLDFIAQEMLREANTIASKAGDLEIARSVVDIKTAVDRIKEQVQNAE